jgi:hypothetical protein
LLFLDIDWDEPLAKNPFYFFDAATSKESDEGLHMPAGHSSKVFADSFQFKTRSKRPVRGDVQKIKGN